MKKGKEERIKTGQIGGIDKEGRRRGLEVDTQEGGKEEKSRSGQIGGRGGGGKEEKIGQIGRKEKDRRIISRQIGGRKDYKWIIGGRKDYKWIDRWKEEGWTVPNLPSMWSLFIPFCLPPSSWNYIKVDGIIDVLLSFSLSSRVFFFAIVIFFLPFFLSSLVLHLVHKCLIFTGFIFSLM